MIKTVIFSLLVAAPLAAVPAAAASNDGQTTALVTARDSDVRSAEALTRVAPKDGGAYIELAQAYVRADRPADAAAAYRRALTLDNEMMETKTGDSIWSRNVARAALVRFPQMSSR
jgi:DNA-binding SARP family transcriptional activator